jgi:hypothetical protein
MEPEESADFCQICVSKLSKPCELCYNNKYQCEYFTLQCGHTFHICCIIWWKKYRNTCPIDDIRLDI